MLYCLQPELHRSTTCGATFSCIGIHYLSHLEPVHTNLHDYVQTPKAGEWHVGVKSEGLACVDN